MRRLVHDSRTAPVRGAEAADASDVAEPLAALLGSSSGWTGRSPAPGRRSPGRREEAQRLHCPLVLVGSDLGDAPTVAPRTADLEAAHRAQITGEVLVDRRASPGGCGRRRHGPGSRAGTRAVCWFHQQGRTISSSSRETGWAGALARTALGSTSVAAAGRSHGPVVGPPEDWSAPDVPGPVVVGVEDAFRRVPAGNGLRRAQELDLAWWSSTRGTCRSPSVASPRRCTTGAMRRSTSLTVSWRPGATTTRRWRCAPVASHWSPLSRCSPPPRPDSFSSLAGTPCRSPGRTAAALHHPARPAPLQRPRDGGPRVRRSTGPDPTSRFDDTDLPEN